MKKGINIKFFRAVLIILSLACISAKDAFAEHYYAKLSVDINSNSPTGAGVVYVNGNQSTQTKEAGSSGGKVQFAVSASPNPGYSFKGWTSGKNGLKPDITITNGYYSMSASTSDGGTNEVTIYGLFAYRTYKITYKPGAGTGSQVEHTGFTYKTSKTLKPFAEISFSSPSATLTYNSCGGNAISPVNTSLAFYKWITPEGGEYSDEADMKDYPATADNVELTAAWAADVTLPTPTKTVLGASYTFAGWYDAETGGNRVGGGGDTYSLKGTTTLYARWQESDITINVSAGTGYRPNDSIMFTVTNGSTVSYTVPVKLSSSSVSVTLKDVPNGTYTVTPINWSWSYTASASSATKSVSGDTDFDFTFTPKSPVKDHDEKSKVNWHN